MAGSYDVIVIGCGLAGVSTAFYLRSGGARVLVLDRAPGPARETSFANGSLITPSLADPWNSPGVLGALLRSLRDEHSPMLVRMRAMPSLAVWGLRFLRNSSPARFQASYLTNVRLAHYSQAVMGALLQSHPLDFEYAPDGTIKVFRDRAAFDAGLRVANWLKQVQVAHEVLNPDALLALEPALEPTIDQFHGGVRYPDDEVGNARLFTEALHRVSAAADVDFRFSAQVLSVERRGKIITGVMTPTGPLRADRYVLAAGSFSWPLGKKLGIKVPVRPAKGYSITLPIGDAYPAPRYAIVDEALHAAVVPLGGDKLRVAGTAEFAGYDQTLTPGRVANLKVLAQQVFPQVAVDGANVEAWCGLRPMTPDGMPILGATPVSNLFVNTGHGPLGWTLACGSGKAVANAVLERQPEFDIAPFALSRF